MDREQTRRVARAAHRGAGSVAFQLPIGQAPAWVAVNGGEHVGASAECGVRERAGGKDHLIMIFSHHTPRFRG